MNQPREAAVKNRCGARFTSNTPRKLRESPDKKKSMHVDA